MYTVCVLTLVVTAAYFVDLAGRKAGAGGKLHFTFALIATFLMIALFGFVKGLAVGAVIATCAKYILIGAYTFFSLLFSGFAYLAEVGFTSASVAADA